VAIRARPEAVWRVLADFARYAAWNPYLVQAEGEAREGQPLRLRVQHVEGGRLRRRRARLVRLEPGRALCWRARLLVPGLLDRRHCLHLEDDGEGTRVVQTEELGGLLGAVWPRPLHERTRAAMAAMNEALKDRVERQAGRPAPPPEPEPAA
jgi:hypothetical protein